MTEDTSLPGKDESDLPPGLSRATPPVSDSAEASLTVHTQYELRGPLNQILRHSEILLEQAAESDQEDLVLELLLIRNAGRQSLSIMNFILSQANEKGRRLARRDLHRLRDEIYNTLREAIHYCRMLQARTSSSGAERFGADLAKIVEAAERLIALIDGEINGVVVESAPATDLSTLEPPPRTRARETTSELMAVAHGSLLLVDDQESSRDPLARRLEKMGFTVTSAQNGRLALDVLRAEPSRFDLVLLDAVMPELNGDQTLEILNADPALRQLPVIMLADQEDMTRALRWFELGAEDCLARPVDLELLRLRITASLEKKRLHDQELLYAQHAARLSEAAAAIEAGTFDPESLNDVTARADSLGRLARAFQRMAREVYTREQRLKSQLQGLRAQVEEARRSQRASDLFDAEYFRRLTAKAEESRDRRATWSDRTDPGTDPARTTETLAAVEPPPASERLKEMETQARTGPEPRRVARLLSDLSRLASDPIKVMRLLLVCFEISGPELNEGLETLPLIDQPTNASLDEILKTLLDQRWLIRTLELPFPVYKLNLRR